MDVKRSSVIMLMRAAVRRGQSRTSFLSDMAAKGLTYARKEMIVDWSSTTELIAKEGILRYVRKDAYPAKKTLATVEWDIEGEYMYKVKVHSRLRPDEPLTERFVNIVSDNPMTPTMIAEAVVEKWTEWEDYTAEAIEKITPWSAFRTTI